MDYYVTLLEQMQQTLQSQGIRCSLDAAHDWLMLTTAKCDIDEIHYQHERQWLDSGRPRYIFKSRIIPMVLDTPLNSIPVAMIAPPHNSTAVLISFEHRLQELTVDAYHIGSVLLAKSSTAEGVQSLFLQPHFYNDEGSILYYFSFVVILRPDVDAETALREVEHRAIATLAEPGLFPVPESPRYKHALFNAARLAVMAGFMSNSTNERLTLVTPMLLARDKPKWNDANEQEREEMVKRARKAGLNAYEIGNQLDLGEFEHPKWRRSNGDGTNERSNAFIRRGHFRLQRYGEGLRNIKVIWIPSTVCRPDLPFKQYG